jgi:hypothetical protein
MADEMARGIRAYDLTLPGKPLVPAWAPLRFDPAQMEANARRAQAERRENEKRIARDTDRATAGWQALSDRLAGNPVATAVLRLHQPQAGHQHVVCIECLEEDYDSGTPAPWPCRTFEAMEDAANA